MELFKKPKFQVKTPVKTDYFGLRFIDRQAFECKHLHRNKSNGPQHTPSVA